MNCPSMYQKRYLNKQIYIMLTMLYRIIDEFGNNRLFSFLYKNYIRTLNLKGNERVLDFGSGSGAGSKHLAKILQKSGGHITCIDISKYWTEKAKNE